MAMDWIIDIPRNLADASLVWMRTFLEHFDTTKLSYLRLDRGNDKYEGVYGACYFPTKQRPTFWIDCHVPGPFPGVTVTRKKPVYRRPDGTFPRAPRGCRRGLRCVDPNSGRQWYRVLGKTRLDTLDEAVVWIVSHESFHFLRRTRQIPGRDNEIEADRFADKNLESFRVECRKNAPLSGAQITFSWIC